MTVDEEKTLRHMLRYDAVLFGSSFGGVFAAYPSGNRRRKPVCWLEKDVVERMLELGWLTGSGDRVHVSPALEAKLQGGDNPDRRYDKLDGCASGGPNSGMMSYRLSVLQRLARRKDHYGRPILSAAQVEAGRHFARDYMTGGLGFSATQNYQTSGADISGRHSRAEDAVLSRIDRRKRVSEAIACLGPGLDRAVIAVCCEDWSLDAVERSENWAKNSGKTILIMALERLAQFYGTKPGVDASR